MIKALGAVVVGMTSLCSTAVLAQGGGSSSNRHDDGGVFYGGTIGVGFGDVDYWELAPMVGKYLNPQVAVGGSLIYRHRSDDRYSKKLTTDDYGFSVFGRYLVSPTIFAQAEYEYLNYEYYRANLSKDSDSANSFFVGGGMRAPAGRNASLYATALYNVLHDDDSPYDSPWVIRFGVGVGF
jgi:hypothetical protein